MANHESAPQVCGVILAGGKSRRMGTNKAFVELDGLALIERVIKRIQPLCSSLVIVANDTSGYEHIGLRTLRDVFPERGALGGIYTGLSAAAESWVLAVACDMPFLNRGLLSYQISLCRAYDVVIPRAADLSSKTPHAGGRSAPDPMRKFAKDNNLHPLHAVYSKDCLNAMRTRLEIEDLRLPGFYEDVNVRIVEPEEIDLYDPRHLSFFNVNTPEDLRTAENLRDQDQG